MKLFISKDLTPGHLNKEIKKTFPYLKLEFYSLKHKIGESSHFMKKVDENNKLAEIRPNIKPSVIEIQPSDVVSVVEQRFQDEFGLPVQVCRKAGDIWVETAQTDNLTLEKQNNMGAGASRRRIENMYTLLL